MRIRQFKIDDLSDVIEFSKAAYGWPSEEEAPGELYLLCNKIMSQYSSEPEGMFVAEHEGKVIGSCFADMPNPAQKEGALHYMGVDPQIQRHGIGAKLLERAMSYLEERGAKTVRLGTDRPLAMWFYLKEGFRIVGWSLVKEVSEKEEPGDVVDQLREAIEQYTSFLFTFRNRYAVEQRIRGVLEADLSPQQKAARLCELAEEHLHYKATPETRSRLEHDINRALTSSDCAGAG